MLLRVIDNTLSGGQLVKNSFFLSHSHFPLLDVETLNIVWKGNRGEIRKRCIFLVQMIEFVGMFMHVFPLGMCTSNDLFSYKLK